MRIRSYLCASILTASLTVLSARAHAQSLLCPSGTPPPGGFPVVFVVPGNAFGPAGASQLTSALINEIVTTRRAACTSFISHSYLTGQAAFESQIIAKIAAVAASADAAAGRINRSRFGIMGFSAGGIVSLTALFRYTTGTNYRIKAAGSYYGSDLRALFGLHDLRGRGIATSVNPSYLRDKDHYITCLTAGGPMNCGVFSRSILAVLRNNMGGIDLNKASFFSPSAAAAAAPPSLPVRFSMCVGHADDNVAPNTSRIALSSTLTRPNVTGAIYQYSGGHGVPHTACPAVLNDVLAAL